MTSGRHVSLADLGGGGSERAIRNAAPDEENMGRTASIALRRLLAPVDALVLGAAVALLALALLAAEATAQEQPVGVTLELNKTEDQTAGCRVYFVLDNKTASVFDQFKLDLVVFAVDGVILRNLATEMGPLRPEKRVVKMFDLGELACAGIGSLLVNDVLACSTDGEPRTDCVELLAVESRTPVALMK
jgi:hypothetical protein